MFSKDCAIDCNPWKVGGKKRERVICGAFPGRSPLKFSGLPKSHIRHPKGGMCVRVPKSAVKPLTPALLPGRERPWQRGSDPRAQKDRRGRNAIGRTGLSARSRGAEGGPGGLPRHWGVIEASALKLHQLHQEIVAGGDHLGIGLECALGCNQVDELRVEIHIGLFQGAGSNVPKRAGGRFSDGRLSRCRGQTRKGCRLFRSTPGCW